MENHLKYKYHLLLVVLSDAKIGLTHGKDLALVELGEETIERVGGAERRREGDDVLLRPLQHVALHLRRAGCPVYGKVCERISPRVSH